MMHEVLVNEDETRVNYSRKSLFLGKFLKINL